ncbi:MAG: DUF4286 family protein [Chitinophagaceae bacterium]
MIIYNITTKVHSSIDEPWLQWLQQEYIPAIMATGHFTGYKLCRLLEQDDSEGNTYAIQYFAPTPVSYKAYDVQHSATMRKKALDKWGGHTISFHSVMEIIA